MDSNNIYWQASINEEFNFTHLLSNPAERDAKYITSINVSGIKITEPVTAITDLLLSAVCLFAFFRLRKTRSSIPTVKLFSYYFLTLSITAAYGGIIGHAFIHLLSFSWKIPAWILSMISVALIERAAIIHAQPYLKRGTGRFFATLNIVELITLNIIVLYTQVFFFVEVHAAYGLLVIVFSFELFIFMKTREKGSRLILYAVMVSALAAIVHVTRFAPHKWFNHNDLGHVLVSIAIYIYYLGSKRIHVDHLKQE
jgi:hypothetical protein